MPLEKLCCFCKAYFHVEWTKTTLLIFAMPVLLLFMIMHLLAIVMADNCGTLVSHTPHCIKIGRTVLNEGGSAVDAAIATMFCEGVYGPKEIGLGGGFTGLIYVSGRMHSLTATPTTPEKLPVEKINKKENLPRSMLGGVPGELLGYWEMHRKYGLLPWKKLIEPSLKLCNEGIDISNAQYVRSHRVRRRRDLLPKSFRYPNHVNGILKLPVLAKTLEKIANEGANVFYNGELGEAFVRDVQRDGGILTMNDLRNYNVSWSRDVVSFHLPHNFKVYTTPLPSSGVIVALAMNIIKGWKDFERPVFWHRFVEATKHALGLGLRLGDFEHEDNATTANYIKETYKRMLDMDFAREMRKKIHDLRAFNGSQDYGSKYQYFIRDTESSVHVAVLAPNGDAVSLTSSLTWPHGVPFLSESTGIYWNDRLRSFSMLNAWIPPGPRANPWKRFLMPHAPIIALPHFESNPRLIVGATGGAHMPAQIITVLTKFCLQRMTIRRAMNSGYILPQMSKDWVEYEDDNPKRVVDYLRKVGHKLNFLGDRLLHFGTIAIARINGMPFPEISARYLNSGLAVSPVTSIFRFFLTIVICIFIALLLILMADYFRSKQRVYHVHESISMLHL